MGECLIRWAFIVLREKGNKKLTLQDMSIILDSWLEKHSRLDKKIWLLLCHLFWFCLLGL